MNMKENKALEFNLSRFTTTSSYFHIEEKTMMGNFDLHYHNYFEIELFIDGEGYQFINGERYEIKKGLFYILAPSDLHQLFFTKETRIITIGFDYHIIPNNIDKSFMDTSKIHYLNNDEFNNLLNVFYFISNEFNSQQQYSNIIIDNLLLSILYVLFRKSKITSQRPKKQSPISESLNYINSHFNENPTLEQVADMAHLNPIYFSALFKKSLKQTFSNYLMKLKIDNAKKLLLSTNLSIIEIAFASGFDSLSSFYRNFKQVTNLSPNDFRQQQ